MAASEPHPDRPRPARGNAEAADRWPRGGARFGPAEYELKYEIDRFRLDAVAAHLSLLCRPDPDYPENVVVSVYFDTPGRHFVREKLDSDYVKTKVRVRWYEGPQGATPAFLEVKRRIGNRRRKARFSGVLDGPALRRSATAAGGVAVAERLRWGGLAIGGQLEPLLVVWYRRRRWVEPRSRLRVCLDTEIRATAPGRGLGVALAGGVMEIKGGSALPPAALGHLVQAGCLPASFSKYGRCYLQLTGGMS